MAHRSSMVRAIRNHAAPLSSGNTLSSLSTPANIVSNSATQTPPVDGHPTLRKRFSRIVDIGASSTRNTPSTSGPPPNSSCATIEYRSSLSHHLAPRRSQLLTEGTFGSLFVKTFDRRVQRVEPQEPEIDSFIFVKDDHITARRPRVNADIVALSSTRTVELYGHVLLKQVWAKGAGEGDIWPWQTEELRFARKGWTVSPSLSR